MDSTLPEDAINVSANYICFSKGRWRSVGPCVYTWRGQKRRLISLRRAIGLNAVPTKKDLEAAKRAFERANKARLDAMTDDEIDAAAEADPDNPPATDDELARAWRVTPVAKTAAE